MPFLTDGQVRVLEGMSPGHMLSVTTDTTIDPASNAVGDVQPAGTTCIAKKEIASKGLRYTEGMKGKFPAEYGRHGLGEDRGRRCYG